MKNYQGRDGIRPMLGKASAVILAALLASGFTLQADPQIVAWGSNLYGQTNVPPSLSNVVAIASGGFTSLALQADGTVAAWGWSAEGQTNVPPGLTNAVAIGAGGFSGMAVQSDGRVAIWGDSFGLGSSDLAALTNAVAVAGAMESSYGLVLRADGTVTVLPDAGPVDPPAGIGQVTAVAAGAFHCLALQADGTVTAWGYNASGQTAVPTGLTNVVAVAAGTGHSLALRDDGTVVGWGDNTYAQINVPQGLTNAVAIAAGDNFSLALMADGTVTAWGQNSGGQTNVSPGLSNVVAIAAGSAYGLALVGDGRPVINPLPRARTVALGTTTELRAFAVGAPPLTYQWQFAGVDMLGETNSVLRLTNVSAGPYVVRVSNSLGNATNSATVVEVVQMLVAVQPQSRVAWQREEVSFLAVAAGAGPFSYQWQFNGTDLPGETNTTLALPLVQPDQTGVYQARIEGPSGTLFSRAASLKVWPMMAWGFDDIQSHWTIVPASLTNAASLAGGGAHSLALRKDGTVYAWGANSAGQTNVPAGLTNVVAIAAGSQHSVALTADGVATSWGYFGAVNKPISNIVAIAAGGNNTMTLRSDGLVQLWGEMTNVHDAQVAATLTNVVGMACGGFFGRLVLQEDGTAVGWGSSDPLAAVPAGLTNAVAVAVGDSDSLALKADGTVVVWGHNAWYDQMNVPAGLTDVVAISAAKNHSLALKADGTVVDWGSFQFGIPINMPISLTNVVAIAAGGSHSLALIGDGVPFVNTAFPDRGLSIGGSIRWRVAATGAWPFNYQWQFNGVDLVGATNAVLDLTNVQPEQGGLYGVKVGNRFGEAQSRAARLFVSPILAWGTNTFVPGSIPIWLTNVAAIAAGGDHALAFQPDGTVVAWGRNNYGQNNVPARLTNVVAIAAGESHSLALKADGTVTAWGFNSWGQTNVPVGLTNAVAIAAGGSYSLALRANGTVVGWGYSVRLVPVGLTNVTAVAAGYVHSLALKSDGTVIAWGDNSSKQLDVPSDLASVTAVAAGSYHNLALLADGTVVAWGANNAGQTNVPGSLSNVVAIAGGDYHSLALKTDGTLVGWGATNVSQVSPPAGLSGVAAISTGYGYSLALMGGLVPVPQLGGLARTADTWRIAVPTVRGYRYRLEYKDTIPAPWTAFPSPAIPGDDTAKMLSDPSGSGTSRFYRVRVQ